MSLTFVAERSVPFDVIRIDGGTQSRLRLNEAVVAMYAQNMEDGAIFPPATLFFDGKDYWLADGFHRYHANRKNGKQGMVCRITNGTLREAILHSFTVNGLHGLQMTIEDKRRNVLEMLNDFEWSEWSDREIARQCHVSHPFVAKLRRELGNVTKESIKYKDKNGNVQNRKRKEKVEKEPKVDGNVSIDPIAAVAQVTDILEERDEAMAFLIAENESLKDQLAKATAEDPEFAATHIEELREELKQTQVELKAVKASRDMYQKEATELKKQVTYYQRQQRKAA